MVYRKCHNPDCLMYGDVTSACPLGQDSCEHKVCTECNSYFVDKDQKICHICSLKTTCDICYSDFFCPLSEYKRDNKLYYVCSACEETFACTNCGVLTINSDEVLHEVDGGRLCDSCLMDIYNNLPTDRLYCRSCKVLLDPRVAVVSTKCKYCADKKCTKCGKSFIPATSVNQNLCEDCSPTCNKCNKKIIYPEVAINERCIKCASS